MSSAWIVGCGKIGFRHLQALAATDEVSHLVVIEGRKERREELARTQPELAGNGVATKLAVKTYDSIAHAVRHESKPRLVISAVTADQQVRLAPELAALQALNWLVEKPVASSLSALLALQATFAEGAVLDRVYVNCGRAGWPGYKALAETMSQEEGPLHLQVSGQRFGYACNALHILELFRMIMKAQAIECTAALLEPQPGGNKRGPEFEEFCGAATFRTPAGDTLGIDCKADGEPSPLKLSIRRKSDGEELARGDEGEDWIWTRRGETETLGVQPVSQSTAHFAAQVLTGHQPDLPLLADTESSHRALFASLSRGTGRSSWRIT